MGEIAVCYLVSPKTLSVFLGPIAPPFVPKVFIFGLHQMNYLIIGLRMCHDWLQEFALAAFWSAVRLLHI